MTGLQTDASQRRSAPPTEVTRPSNKNAWSSSTWMRVPKVPPFNDVLVETFKIRVVCAFTSMNGASPLGTVARPRGAINVMSLKVMELNGSPTKIQGEVV